MTLTRRALLRAMASTAVIAIAGTPMLAFAADPLAPWAEPGRLATDPRVRALEWAVLVPNPHNRQPWLVELVGEREMRLFCDLDRRLPMTDPYDRQITIGLGCFLEMLTLAAAADGFTAVLTVFPDGAPGETERLDARPVAHVAFEPAAPAADPLFAQAPHRRTGKEAYDDRDADPAALATLAPALRTVAIATITDPAEVKTLTGIAYRSGEVEFITDRTRRESIDLMRIGRREIEANPDGIDLGGPMIEELAAAGVLTRDTMDDVTSPAFQQAAAFYAAPLQNTNGWLVVTSATNDRAAQIDTGRDWLRLNLATTAVGLSMHPYSSALQEFEEVAPFFAEIHAHFGVTAPKRIQMLARIGYGLQLPPSPRWPATSRLL